MRLPSDTRSIIFTLFFAKFVLIVLIERPKINKIEAGDAPLKNKEKRQYSENVGAQQV